MLKRLNKICKVLLLALTFVLGSTGFALAAENEIHISTESMEIRTEGKTGLRTISAIDKAYLEQLKAEGKEVTYGTVAVPASALEAAGGELQIGGSYALKGKLTKLLRFRQRRIGRQQRRRFTIPEFLPGSVEQGLTPDMQSDLI